MLLGVHMIWMPVQLDGINGTIQSTTTGIDTTNSYIPFVKGTTSEESVVNFGQDMTFAGYKTGGADASSSGSTNFSMRLQLDIWLCSKNLSESSVTTAQVINQKRTLLVQYNGPSSGQSITGLGHPDLFG